MILVCFSHRLPMVVIGHMFTAVKGKKLPYKHIGLTQKMSGLSHILLKLSCNCYVEGSCTELQIWNGLSVIQL